MARNSWFQLKQFRIEQDRCSMKVTTDAMLLGAWPSIADKKTILDIGTGTGLLALMAAQQSVANIEAVEIVEEAAKQAQQNFAASPWSSRLHLFHASIQDFTRDNPKNRYDLILCNPPFYQNQTLSKSWFRRVAWHQEALTMEELLVCAFILLAPGGDFSVIFPIKEGQIFMKAAIKRGFFASEILWVRPTSKATANRMILTLTNLWKPLIEEELILFKEHQVYTQEAAELLAPFLLDL